MLYRLLADLVVVAHLAFIAFVAVGAVLAWRRPWLVLLHAPSVAWALATIAVGLPCPLTSLEKSLRGLAGDAGYAGGFVDHYVEGVVYPGSLTPVLRALAAVAVVTGYAGLLRRSAGATGGGRRLGQLLDRPALGVGEALQHGHLHRHQQVAPARGALAADPEGPPAPGAGREAPVSPVRPGTWAPRRRLPGSPRRR